MRIIELLATKQKLTIDREKFLSLSVVEKITFLDSLMQPNAAQLLKKDVAWMTITIRNEVQHLGNEIDRRYWKH